MKYLSKDEVAEVLKIAYRKSTRDHLMLLFSFNHALRRSEIANLRIQDVQEGLIRVDRVKHSLRTEQPLISSPNAIFDETKALAAWLRERTGDGDVLFPSRKGNGKLSGTQVARIAVYYMELAGIREELAHHHSLKHASCAHMIRSGAGLELVKQFAGHKSISSTIHYVHTSDEEAMAAFQRSL